MVPTAAGATTAQRIQAAGLRATRPRVLILELLERRRGHSSADEVAENLDAAGTALPRATVYNVLGDLSERGLVMTADAGPGRALYEVADRWHHHFVCRRCEAIIDVECGVGDKPCLDAAVPGAVVDEAQVIYRGLCAECRGHEAGASA